MGIKFLCPNGHKLHVKGYLSGKRAICPKCGVRVLVPAESSGLADDAEISSVASVTLEVAPASELSRPEIVTAGASGKSAVSVSVPAAASDPIAEAPSAVWYVRPASGGQFGPASGEIMRGWIDDGRVSAIALVWRAGWNEWRSAAETFPQLSSLLVAPGPPLQPLTTPAIASLPRGQVAQMLPPSPPAPEVSSGVAPLAEMSRKRRRRKDVSLIASAVLVAVTVILIIILALVFRAQSAPAQPEGQPEPSPKATARDLTPNSLRG